MRLVTRYPPLPEILTTAIFIEGRKSAVDVGKAVAVDPGD